MVSRRRAVMSRAVGDTLVEAAIVMAVVGVLTALAFNGDTRSPSKTR